VCLEHSRQVLLSLPNISTANKSSNVPCGLLWCTVLFNGLNYSIKVVASSRQCADVPLRNCSLTHSLAHVINLSSRIATASAMSSTPYILIQSAAISEVLIWKIFGLQCFDTVGWEAGGASGL